MDISGSQGTCASGGCDLVGCDNASDLIKVAKGEDEANVSTDVREEAFELRVVCDDRAQSTPDHGIFAHQDDTLAAKGDTNLVHLVGTDIVDIDDEDGG
jgi:hypothetical protein